MKIHSASARILFVVLAVVVASAANAELIVTYGDCRVCQSWGIDTTCQYPSDNGWGYESCVETKSDITNCDTSGSQCMYADTGPGSGGGGGGGWGDCGYQGGYCPPECMSCGNYY